MAMNATMLKGAVTLAIGARLTNNMAAAVAKSETTKAPKKLWVNPPWVKIYSRGSRSEKKLKAASTSMSTAPMMPYNAKSGLPMRTNMMVMISAWLKESTLLLFLS